VINDCCSTENDKSLLTVNDESNLFTSSSFQSLLLCSIIIHYLSDSSHLMNLNFLFSQCFWFEKSKKWKMSIIQFLSWISDEKILIEDFCWKTFNDDSLSQWQQSLSINNNNLLHYLLILSLQSFLMWNTWFRLSQCCRIVWWLVFMWCLEEIVCCMYRWRLNDDDLFSMNDDDSLSVNNNSFLSVNDDDLLSTNSSNLLHYLLILSLQSFLMWNTWFRLS